MSSKFDIQAAAQFVADHAKFNQFVAAPRFADTEPNFNFAFVDARSNFVFPLGTFDQGQFRATHLAFVNFADHEKFGAVAFEDSGFEQFVSQFPSFAFERFAVDGKEFGGKAFGDGKETAHTRFPFSHGPASRLAGALLIAALLTATLAGHGHSHVATVSLPASLTTVPISHQLHLCQEQPPARGHGHHRHATA